VENFRKKTGDLKYADKARNKEKEIVEGKDRDKK